jgi:hypothetical protein
MSQYANNTSVSVERSLAELQKILSRFGATQFAFMQSPKQAKVGFIIEGRRIEMTLILPEKDEYKYTPGRNYLRTPQDKEKHWEQGCRSQWRALVEVIKSKLIAIEAKIVSQDNEFLAYTVLPSGETVGEIFSPQIQKMVDGKKVPLLLIEKQKEAE